MSLLATLRPGSLAPPLMSPPRADLAHNVLGPRRRSTEWKSILWCAVRGLRQPESRLRSKSDHGRSGRRVERGPQASWPSLGEAVIQMNETRVTSCFNIMRHCPDGL